MTPFEIKRNTNKMKKINYKHYLFYYISWHMDAVCVREWEKNDWEGGGRTRELMWGGANAKRAELILCY